MVLLGSLAILLGWTTARMVRNRPRSAGAGLSPVSIAAPERYWADHGFVLLEAPMRVPTNSEQTDHIQVWIRIPANALIGTRRLADGRLSLRMPPGTVADRVESVGGAVVDVRGTRFEADGGELFHVLRAARSNSGSLEGVEWMRGDRDGEIAAAARLADLVRTTDGPRAARVFGEFMDCQSCHAADRPESRQVRTDDLPNRGTDGSGLYQVLAVLSDDAPLEFNRPRDLNVDDPKVRIACADGRSPAVVREAGGAVRAGCADGSVPRGRLALADTLRAGSQRAAAICRARVYLAAHLDELGRHEFEAALRECLNART